MNSPTTKFHITTTFLIIISLFSFSIPSFSFSGKDCGNNCFSSEIISIEPDGECFWYEVEVASGFGCRFELSHYNIDPGCGIISEASNSEGWPVELNGTDPTTGLAGLKVDNICGFGKTLRKFTVRFKFCPDDSCSGNPECLTPEVAYKAGRCVFYDELEASCPKDPLLVETTTAEPTCFNSEGGSINLSIHGGVPPYSVLWNTGETDSLLSEIPGGQYHYKVTDSNNEVVEGDVTLHSPESVAVAGTITQPACDGVHTGAITLQLSGGAGAYTFLWDNGSTEKDRNGLSAGTYSVTVTDENGCFALDTFRLEYQNSITAVPYIVQPTCGENNFGSIELDVTGGAEPYQFAWSDGDESQNRYDLSDGYYDVTITDQSGCQISRSYSIRTRTSLSASSTITHANCFNDPVGSIDLYVTGGTGPYTYEWSDGSATEDLENISAGKHSVIVTDAKGCQLTYYANVYQQNIQVYAWATQYPSCPGSEDAVVDGMAFFGTGPLTYEWSSGATTEDLSNVGAGQYTLTVTDSLGCTGSATAVITDPDSINIGYEVVPVGCIDNTSYDISLNVNGGTGPYSYDWSNGETSENLVGQQEGIYTVVVTDATGCSVTREIIADGSPGEIACIINEPDSVPVCGSSGNILTSSIEGAVSYQWTVTSTDGQWQITSLNDGATVEYTTGGEGSQATFALEVLLESGCITTCSYSTAVCDNETPNGNPGNEDGSDDPDDPDNGDGGDNPDDGNGSDNGSGDHGNDSPENPEKPCDECFYTSPLVVERDGGLFKYVVTVNHNSECQYDLSHFTIEIPKCAKIVDYSNSMNWAMEVVKADPTTGISGIKVDNIPSFGKQSNLTSFEVTIVLKSWDYECINSLKCFEPEVAYKASTCVYYEQTEGDCAIISEEPPIAINAYPNPTCDRINIKINDEFNQEHYDVDLMDFQGKVISSRKISGFEREFAFDLSSYKCELFFVKVTGANGWQKLIRVLKN